MLLTITTTHRPATDLGYLLHKHPARAQTFDLAFGSAHVFYPKATDDECTAALLVEVDPIALVRTRRGPAGEGRSLEQYVNDRPYAASSFLSVAIARVFSSAMSGKSQSRADLADTPIPLVVELPVLPCRGGAGLLRALLEPLGYAIEAEPIALDEQFPEWGPSPYFRVRLSAQLPLKLMLSHLYVLIPVLDGDKHYWIGEDEIEKLLRRGEGWLAAHPAKEQIARRYLRRRGYLVREALARLVPDEAQDPDEKLHEREQEEESIEKPLKLHDARLETVLAELKAIGARRVVDLGCGEGKLVRLLMRERQFQEIAALDVAFGSLERAREKLERQPQSIKDRVKLLHGSLMYRDERLAGYDAAAIVEVIEHLDEPRLAAFERVIFEFARPGTVVITTPNSEFNALFPTLPAGKFRHKDHRFEWTRAEFEAWSKRIADRFGYAVRFAPIGPLDPNLGAPTQMGVFTRENHAA